MLGVVLKDAAPAFSCLVQNDHSHLFQTFQLDHELDGSLLAMKFELSEFIALGVKQPEPQLRRSVSTGIQHDRAAMVVPAEASPQRPTHTWVRDLHRLRIVLLEHPS